MTRRYQCPYCDGVTERIYRCDECQKDLVDDELEPVDKPTTTISNPDHLAEARAVAGDLDRSSTHSGDSPDLDWTFVDWLNQQHDVDDVTDGDQNGSLMAAAMGDPDASTDFQREDTRSETISEPSTNRSVGGPTASLPLAQLDALRPEQRREFARRRGLDWPTTDEARDRLADTIHNVMRHEDTRVVDAPTSLGKTHTIAATRWGARDDLTGDRPVVHLLETRDARDEAAQVAEEDGGRHIVLEARHEACTVAAGDHDPAEGDDEREPEQVITIGGQAASEWIREMCDDRGIPFSAAHRVLEDGNDQGADLPCMADGECSAIAQWDAYREGPSDKDYWPLVIATHNFAHVPGVRMGNNVVVDEQPDYRQDLSTDRVRRAVGAYLREIDAPAGTWEQFIQLATFDPETYDAVADEIARERDELQDALDREPDREWYFENADAHTLAPALARAIFHAEERANGRRAGKTMYEPPRLDANARDEDSWNIEWVSVVLDESNDVRTVRVTPHFGAARSVIGLDAHPALPVWQANCHPDIQPAGVLEPEERQLWRRYERGLRVVQVGDATRPLASGEYFDWAGTQALVEQLHDEYGRVFRTAITAKAVEGDLKSIMSEFVADPETMHYGEERSRNDFAGEGVGLVNGCIDPGDDYVLDLLAELDLEAAPERSDGECGHCEGDGCYECGGTGRKRAHGRGFEGEDAATAQAILAAVRENHTAQAAGRYARNPDDPDDTATVFVRTDAMPPGFADLQVPGVTWTFTKTQQRIVEQLRESDQPRTAREIAEAVDCSKEYVRKTLDRLLPDEDDVDRRSPVQAFEDAGSHGATLYVDSGLPNAGVVDLEEIANDPVWDSYTWALAIRTPGEGDPERDESQTAAAEHPPSIWPPERANSGYDPPD